MRSFRRELLAGLIMILLGAVGLAAAAGAATHDGTDPCDRFPLDPRCSTTTTSATSTTSTTTEPPSTTTTRPPDPGSGVVAVIGCSNSRQSAQGYRSVSTVDRLANVSGSELGGGVLERWVDPTNPAYSGLWAVYDKYRPAGGYEDVFPIVCLHNSEHTGSTSAELESKIIDLTDEILSRDPAATIHITGLQLYPVGHVCPLTGALGDVVANQLADYAADLDPNDQIVRGPTLGPITARMITGGNDQCHLTDSGRTFVGSQIVVYFD